MSEILNRSVHRTLILIIKLYPPIGAFLMWTHCITLLMGYDLFVSESVTGLSVVTALVMMLLSIEFRFCVMHKLLLLYIIAMQFCITFEREYGFGEVLIVARWIMLLLGSLLLIRLVSHFERYLNAQPNRRKYKKRRNEAEILQDIYTSLQGHKAFEHKNMMSPDDIKHSIAVALQESGITEQIDELRERLDDFEDDQYYRKRKYCPNMKKNIFSLYKEDEGDTL